MSERMCERTLLVAELRNTAMCKLATSVTLVTASVTVAVASVQVGQTLARHCAVKVEQERYRTSARSNC